MKLKPALLCLLILLLSLIPLTVSAAEPAVTEAEATATAPVSTAPATTAPPAGEEEPTLTLTPSGDGLGEAEAGLFAAIAVFLEGSLGTLIGGATLTLLLTLYLFFRKSLLPKLLAGGEAVFHKAQTAADRLLAADREASERLDRYLAHAEEILKAAEEQGEAAEALAPRLSSLEDECRKMEQVFLRESEMLYHLLMSVSLPEYKKDEIAEAFSNVKKTLSYDEKAADTVSKDAATSEVLR